jgi:hypothetical protein
MSSLTNTPKTIYVHAGMSKTGTTSIQKMLTKNQQILSQKGILYPNAARKNGIGHHSLAAFIKQGKDSDEALKLQAEIEECEHSTVIVSTELLERMSRQKWQSLKTFFAPHHVKIIYYLRRQDDAIVSMYNELVKKHAVNQDFSTYVETSPRVDLLDYRATLSVIEDVVGFQNMSIGIFSKSSLKHGNIGNDFIARIQPECAELQAFSAPHDNSSLMPASAMLMARINRQVDFNIDHSKFYGPACKLAEVVNNQVKGMTTVRHDYFKTDQQRDVFLQKFAESNQFISDKYLQGQAVIQNPTSEASHMLTEAEEREMLNVVLASVIEQFSKETGPRDGLAKVIGLLWQDKLKHMTKE